MTSQSLWPICVIYNYVYTSVCNTCHTHKKITYLLIYILFTLYHSLGCGSFLLWPITILICIPCYTYTLSNTKYNLQFCLVLKHIWSFIWRFAQDITTPLQHAPTPLHGHSIKWLQGSEMCDVHIICHWMETHTKYINNAIWYYSGCHYCLHFNKIQTMYVIHYYCNCIM